MRYRTTGLLIVFCCSILSFFAQSDTTFRIKKIGLDFSPLSFFDIKPNFQIGTLLQIREKIWIGQQVGVINPYTPFFGIANYSQDIFYKNTYGLKLKTDAKFEMKKASDNRHIFYIGPELYYQVEQSKSEVTYGRYNNSYFQEILTKKLYNMLGANFRFGGIASGFKTKQVYFEYFFSVGVRYLNISIPTKLPEDADELNRGLLSGMNYTYGISPVAGNNYILPYFGVGMRLGGWIK